MSLNLKNRFTKGATAGALALSMAFSPMALADDSAANTNTSATAHATNVSSTASSATAPAPNAWDLARSAQRYSKDNDAVGMFVTIAPGSGFTHQSLGDALVRKFAREGIQAKYTFNYAESGDSVIDFFVRGVPYTGYGLGKLEEGYTLVAKTIRALRSDRVANADFAYNND